MSDQPSAIGGGSKKPLIELSAKLTVKGTAPNYEPASDIDAILILDGFSTANQRMPLRFEVTNQTAGSRTYTDEVVIRSMAGTPNNPNDDLTLTFRLKEGRWELGP